MRKRLNDEQQRHLMARGSSLAAISQHPSWPDFLEEIEAKATRLEKRTLSLCMGVAPVNQRDIDYTRGFINGMQYIALLSENAEARLEDYLKKQAGMELEGATR